jgi:hypothetical protein
MPWTWIQIPSFLRPLQLIQQLNRRKHPVALLLLTETREELMEVR